MLALHIPPGTTLESLVTTVLPKEHAATVPAGTRGATRIGLSVDGAGSWLLAVDGLAVTTTAAKDPGAVDLRLHTTKGAVTAFLADWTGPRTLVPKLQPAAGQPRVPTDPRILARVVAVSGSLEIALRDMDLGGGKRGRVALTIGAGSAAKKPYFFEEPDAVVETSVATFQRLLAGTLTPDAALADGDVKVTGKRLVAMQYAFAVAPFQPKAP